MHGDLHKIYIYILFLLVKTKTDIIAAKPIGLVFKVTEQKGLQALSVSSLKKRHNVQFSALKVNN